MGNCCAGAHIRKLILWAESTAGKLPADLKEQGINHGENVYAGTPTDRRNVV